MRKKISIQPEVFNHMPDIFEYEECYMQDGTLYAALAYRTADWQRQAHFEMYQWTHNTAKQFKKDFQSFKEDTKAAGLIEICCTYLDSDAVKWEKFINLVGFPKPEKFYMSIMEL